MCGMKLLIRFQTSTAELLKFGNRNVISIQLSLGMLLIIHAGIKDNESKRDQCSPYNTTRRKDNQLQSLELIITQ